MSGTEKPREGENGGGDKPSVTTEETVRAVDTAINFMRAVAGNEGYNEDGEPKRTIVIIENGLPTGGWID